MTGAMPTTKEAAAVEADKRDEQATVPTAGNLPYSRHRSSNGDFFQIVPSPIISAERERLLFS